MKINERKTEDRASRIAHFAEKLFFFSAAVLFAAAGLYGQSGSAHYIPTRSGTDSALLADPEYTPGATNPAVTQATIHQTICKVGWTASIRPPESYTNSLKLQQMIAYGDTIPQVPKLSKLRPNLSKCLPHSDDPRCYEEDHKIPLEVGGNPRDPKNLYPQPYFPKPAAKEKDPVETYLKKEVCADRILLADAQSQINGDWLPIYETIKTRRKHK